MPCCTTNNVEEWRGDKSEKLTREEASETGWG